MEKMKPISNILQADISEIIGDTGIPWHMLKGGTVFITGATGLIGALLVRVMKAADLKFGLNLTIIGQGRNKELGMKLKSELKIDFLLGDLRDKETLAPLSCLDYVIHCASITKSFAMINAPVDVLETQAMGTKNILELVKGKSFKSLKSFLLLSSMEIYGNLSTIEASENDLGYLDLFNPRSSYPESKRFCEMLCIAYAAQYDLPIKIARLAQTFGAGTPKDDSRVFAQFARNIMAGQDIELHTEGKSRGNYCYTADALRGLLLILLKGNKGEAYNVANKSASVTIREMAEMIKKDICDDKIKVAVKIPEDIKKCGYAPDSGYTLNTDKLKKLGWNAKYGLREMYQRLLLDWQNGDL
ncbi:MAG: NAD(P)-dependent oxidoreductase [Lachnospiraceae bacterium]|nr:NAD(P)-dependent oxidoreductase [Lachnospiraceae bacterium]